MGGCIQIGLAMVVWFVIVFKGMVYEGEISKSACCIR